MFIILDAKFSSAMTSLFISHIKIFQTEMKLLMVHALE